MNINEQNKFSNIKNLFIEIIFSIIYILNEWLNHFFNKLYCSSISSN
jgi:hypothetical protein